MSKPVATPTHASPPFVLTLPTRASCILHLTLHTPRPLACRAAHFEPLLADMELLAGPALCVATPHLQAAGGPTLGEQQVEQLLGFLAAQGKPRLLQCLMSALQTGRAGGGGEAAGQSAAGEGQLQLQERPSGASPMPPVTAVRAGVVGELSGWQVPATPAAGPAPRPPARLGGGGVQGLGRVPPLLAGSWAEEVPAGSEGAGGSLEGALSLLAVPEEGEGAADHVRHPPAAVARPPSLAPEPAAAAQPSCSGMAAPPASSSAGTAFADVAAGSLGALPAAARAHPGWQFARWAPGPRTGSCSSPIGRCGSALAIAPAAPPRCLPPLYRAPLPTSRCRRLRDACLGFSSPHEEAAYVAAKSGWLVGFDLQARRKNGGGGGWGGHPRTPGQGLPLLSRALLLAR